MKRVEVYHGKIISCLKGVWSASKPSTKGNDLHDGTDVYGPPCWQPINLRSTSSVLAEKLGGKVVELGDRVVSGRTVVVVGGTVVVVGGIVVVVVCIVVVVGGIFVVVAGGTDVVGSWQWIVFFNPLWTVEKLTTTVALKYMKGKAKIGYCAWGVYNQ